MLPTYTAALEGSLAQTRHTGRNCQRPRCPGLARNRRPAGFVGPTLPRKASITPPHRGCLIRDLAWYAQAKFDGGLSIETRQLLQKA